MTLQVKILAPSWERRIIEEVLEKEQGDIKKNEHEGK
jgi:hypothetical protein